MVNCLELATTPGDVVACGDLLGIDCGLDGGPEACVGALGGEANRSGRALSLRQGRWLVAMVLGRDRAHLETGSSHLRAELLRFGLLVLVDCIQVLVSNLLVIALLNRFQTVLLRRAAKFDIGLGELLAELHRVTSADAGGTIADKGRLGLRSVLTGLAEFD